MGPRKISAAEEVEDIKTSVDFLAEVSAVKLQERNILDQVKEMKAMRI